MGTTRKLIVICLALLMGLFAVMPSTFSWYNHSGSHSGDRMKYERENLPVSSGSIAMETKRFEMESNNRNVKYDEKGNKTYQGNALDASGDTVVSNRSQYYGTTFTNSGASPVFVNLYLKTFTNHAKNIIGTLQPNLTHKGISASASLKNKGAIRVYFQFKEANLWKEDNSKIYAVCKSRTGAVSIVTFDKTNNKIENNSSLDNVTTYYANLSDGTESFYFATNGGNDANVNTASGVSFEEVVTKKWFRTNTINDIQSEKGYYLTGEADDTTFHAKYASFNISGGLSVMTYFNNVTICAGQRANLSLSKGTNFTGKSVAYSLQSGNHISINENTGELTATSSFSTGSTATIRTTITSKLGDTTYVDTTVSNPTNLDSVAVATNIMVPPKEDGKNGKAEIVWYIQNDSGDSCTFAKVYYTN